MPARMLADLEARSAPRAPLAVPLSLAAHALGVAALLALPALSPAELPAPRTQPASAVWTPIRVRPPLPAHESTPVPRRAEGRGGPRPLVAPVNAEPGPTRADDIAAAWEDPAPVECYDCGGGGPDLTGSTGATSGAPPGTGDGSGPGLVRVGQVQEPRRLRVVKPDYPPLARAARVQGEVILECVLDVDGRVTEVRAVSGHPLLQPAAIDAVRQWRFTPTLLSGVPVRVALTVTVRFVLS